MKPVAESFKLWYWAVPFLMLRVEGPNDQPVLLPCVSQSVSKKHIEVGLMMWMG